MPKKYDTNPLDPEFPEKARAAAAGEPAREPMPAGGETRRFPDPGSITEEQTRKFSEQEVSAYGAPTYTPPYTGQYVPGQYQRQDFANMNRTSGRTVESLGIPENMLIAAPYIPWYLGMVAGILLLFLVPKSETKVRFHAAQGLAAHVGILIVTMLLGVIGNIADIANFGSFLFTLITSIMLVVWAVKAWRGKPVHIESVDGLTNWLEEKIHPKA